MGSVPTIRGNMRSNSFSVPFSKRKSKRWHLGTFIRNKKYLFGDGVGRQTLPIVRHGGPECRFGRIKDYVNDDFVTIYRPHLPFHFGVEGILARVTHRVIFLLNLFLSDECQLNRQWRNGAGSES